MMEKPRCRRFNRLAPALARFAPVAAIALAFSLAPVSAHAELKEIAPGLKAEVSSAEVKEGGIVLITVESDSALKAEELEAAFDGKDIPFYELPEANHYGAVFGVNHDLKPGPAELAIHTGAKKGALTINVLDGDFSSESLKVQAKQVNPPKKAMKGILREQHEVGQIYKTLTREKRWDGPFKLPIDSPITSPFGTKRMYNGEQRNYHPGMDLKAPKGTPIHAPAAGKVMMAKKLYFTGNTVILDHGYGVITVYAHMSKLKVKVGRVVKAGDLLGLSGKTGRASGPHLHWQAVIGAVKVNPLELTKVMK
jgi:murein DD-endopeptidase MepM/ murein hydrolase activator NlpD